MLFRSLGKRPAGLLEVDEGVYCCSAFSFQVSFSSCFYCSFHSLLAVQVRLLLRRCHGRVPLLVLLSSDVARRLGGSGAVDGSSYVARRFGGPGVCFFWSPTRCSSRPAGTVVAEAEQRRAAARSQGAADSPQHGHTSIGILPAGGGGQADDAGTSY